MKIKNLTVKPIGFGTTVVLPDETAELPKGYDKSHPTVKYYLSRKWVKEVGSAGGDGAKASDVNVNVNTGGGDDSTAKPLDRMNKEALQALAFERGVEFAETDTKQMLIDKIKAAQDSGE